MAFTLEQLFQNGGHRTVEQLVLEKRATIAEISAALGRRFGAENIPGADVLNELRGRVIGGINIGNALERGINPTINEYAINPAISDAFSYTVVAEIPDPFSPGGTVSIPWTINSPKTMTIDEIIERAAEELLSGIAEPDYPPTAQYASAIRNRSRFIEGVKRKTYEGGNLDINILGVYRRE